MIAACAGNLNCTGQSARCNILNVCAELAILQCAPYLTIDLGQLECHLLSINTLKYASKLY